MSLLLRALDVAGPLRWRWLLTDEETGAPLADHQVALDPAASEVARFRNLYGYVEAYAAPDRRVSDGARIVGEAGEWAAHELLGEPIVAAVIAEAPVTVRVVVPETLDDVSLWPLELANAGGRPLAAQGDVSFVYDIDGRDFGGPAKPAPGDQLRMLAVFSQPTQTSVLALRQERYELSRLIRRIAARERANIALRIIQYGVTRQRLANIADAGDGWDVLHLSGHGGVGMFALEKDDGSPDLVATGELVGLLRPVKRRVKLAVVSACESGADTTAQTLRLLGLTEQAEALEGAALADEPVTGAELVTRDATEVSGLARALMRDLACPVVAMRYPVTDEYANAFADAFYEQLLSRGQPVAAAVARAVAEAVGASPSAARPAVSLVTPMVFGSRAAGLRLDAPRGTPVIDPAGQRMAHFPAEPVRFVGRAEAMARASAALAPGSGRAAVLLYGMAGAGKTACALELAYRHQDSFAAATFWQAPPADDEFGAALASLAIQLEVQLGDYGFAMADKITTIESLTRFTPRLRRLLEDNGVLLVLDNMETLLTPAGTWRDPRWGPLMAALTDHDGESRVIMTSRIAPAGLGAGAATLPVHALSLGESVALARELPNLRLLLHADAGPLRAAQASQEAEVAADRDRVRRVLRVVQGHPKLMALADAAAADRQRLDAQLEAAEAAAAGQHLEAFFKRGASILDAREFLDTLATWTSTMLSGFPGPTRLMAEFLACLEEGDRQSAIVGANWADLWRRLERPGEPPDPQRALDALVSAALIQHEALAAPEDAGEPVPLAYQMHPAVAATAENLAGAGVRSAADVELGAFWQAIAYQASDPSGGEDTSMVVRAALAAAPYLLRREQWDAVGALLERAVARDHSPAVAQQVLPALRQIAAATGATRDLAVFGRVLEAVDPAEAERLQREAMEHSLGDGDFRVAVSVASSLISLLVSSGRLREALDLTPAMTDWAERARLGPWSQAACRATRLQVLGMLGEHERLLAEGGALRDQLAALPSAAADESVQPWNVYETVLDTMRNSALAIADLPMVLELNAEVTASMRRRGAGPYEIARTQLNDAAPLIRLGRLAEAGGLLSSCQRVFEDYADTTMLAHVLSARASLEAALGHQQAAVDLEATALRLSYARPVPATIGASHQDLAAYLFGSGAADHDVLSHQLAAALIFRLTGATHDLARALRAAARTIRTPSGSAIGLTLAALISVAEQTEGVRLGALISALSPNPAAANGAFQWVLAAAAEPAMIEADKDEGRVLSAQPTVFADTVVAAVRGDPLARSSLDRALPALLAAPETAVLARWVTRVLEGANPAAELVAVAEPDGDDSAVLMNYIASQLSS